MDTAIAPPVCRSALYMPASNEKAVSKGPTLAADAIILDLEDSVSPALKEIARQQAQEALRSLDYGKRLRVIRCNGTDTTWFEDDLSMCIEAQPNAILLPKVESPQTIESVRDRLDILGAHPDIQIWAMLETPKAVLAAADIAATSARCSRLTTFCIGNNDLAREANMPVRSDRTYLIPWLMTILLAAKAYRLVVLDGVYNNFADVKGFALECAEGAAMGMNGKTLIHPSQIADANLAYSPSADEIEKAKLVVATFDLPENKTAGAVQINGQMVERLHLEMALQTLKRANIDQ